MRRLLIVASKSVIKRHVHKARRFVIWLGGLLARKSPMVAAVALANKMARVVWALLAQAVCGLRPWRRKPARAPGRRSGEGKERYGARIVKRSGGSERNGAPSSARL